MQYFANLPIDRDVDAGAWAREREREGWHGVCASDHLWLGPLSYPHVWVTLTHMACATERIALTSSFCNNLFRSPVEFAQASLNLHAVSGGRFEAGLGAGWSEEEMLRTGRVFPEAPARVSMYREAIVIAHELLHTGRCSFKGEHYQIGVATPPLAHFSHSPPPLIGSAGGPRTVREITPLVDRMEIKPNARATRRGHLDLGTYGGIREEEVRNLVLLAREQSDVPIGTFVMIGSGDPATTAGLKGLVGDGFLSRFVDEAEVVAKAVRDLEAFGLDRVQLTEFIPGSLERIRPYLDLVPRETP